MCTKVHEAPSILSSRIIRTHRMNSMENFRLQERLHLIDQELQQIYCQHCMDIQDVRDNLGKIKEVKKGMEISVERRKLLLSQGFRIVPSTTDRATPLVLKNTDEDGNQARSSSSENGFHDGRTLPWDHEDPVSASTSGRQTPGFTKVVPFRKIIPPFNVGSRRNFIQTYTLAKSTNDSSHVEESSDGHHISKRKINKRPKTAASSSATLLRVHSPGSAKKKGRKIKLRPQSTPLINIETAVDSSWSQDSKSEQSYNTYSATEKSDDEEFFEQFKNINAANGFIDSNSFVDPSYVGKGLRKEVGNSDGRSFKRKGDDENKQRNDNDSLSVTRYLSVEQSGTHGKYQTGNLNSGKGNAVNNNPTLKEFRKNENSNKLDSKQHVRLKTSTPVRGRNSSSDKYGVTEGEFINSDDNKVESHGFLMLSEMKEVKTREQLISQRPTSPRVEAWVDSNRPTTPALTTLEETLLNNMPVSRSRPSSAALSRPGSAHGIQPPSRPGSALSVQLSRPNSAQSIRSRPGSARGNIPHMSPTVVNFANKAESIISESPSERGRREAVKKRTHRPRVTKEAVYDARPNKALSHGYSTMQMTIGNRQVKIFVPKFVTDTDELVGNARAKAANKKAAFGHAKKV